MVKSILALALLAAIVLGFIWGLVNFVGLQTSLIWTAVIGAIAWAAQTAVQQKQEHQRLLADQKRQQYFEFLDFLNEIIDSSGEPLRDEKRLRHLRRWSLRLTKIGSDEVVRAWNNVRASGILNEQQERQKDDSKSKQTVQVLHGWGLLWLAMRRDCGHVDTKLTITEMLASFVNDIGQYQSELEAPNGGKGAVKGK